MTRYVPVPRALTTPIAAPEPPPRNCTWHGGPSVCVLDALAQIERWRGVWQQANADRATLRNIDMQAIKESHESGR